jgi:hypothetical protein
MPVPSFIRDPKDFWSGIIFGAIGLAAIIIGQDYSTGAAAQMGPAYCSAIPAALLTVIWIVTFLKFIVKSGEGLVRFAVKEFLLIFVATLLFGLLVRRAGLAIAVTVLVMVSGYAIVKFEFASFLAVALFLVAFSVLVFVIRLGLPLPLIGLWFGF